ncbi:MAG TPA: hypothetical protein VFU57_06060 [Candidatus Acidoferrales bacterium]|nr:hypothetical protein [Candidatus Acidoferrales bacterium]
MPSKPQTRQATRNWPAVVFGAAILITALVAVFHPQFSYSFAHHYAQIGPQKVLFETRKVFHVPLWCSIPIATIAAVVIIAGARKA